MRLVGYSFARGRFPLEAGHVRLDDLTVVMGPNDAGKSRLLSALRHDLESPARVDFSESVFFCEGTDEEAAFVLSNALSDVSVVPEWSGKEEGQFYASTEGEAATFPHPKGGRSFWRLGVWRGSALDGHQISDFARVREQWTAALRMELPPERSDSAAWDLLLAELGASNLLALEPYGQSVEGELAFNVYWCLPPPADLEPDVALALASSGLYMSSDGEGAPSGRQTWRGHLLQPEAPVIVAPVGRTAMAVVPTPVTVPTDFSTLCEGCERAVTSLVEHMRWGAQDRLDELAGEESTRRPPVEVWRQKNGEDTFATTVHEDALVATDVLSEAATALLPRFVSDRYEVRVLVRDITDWPGGIIELWLAESGGVEGACCFRVEDVADGHRLWVQLALLEGVQLLRRQQAYLRLLVDTWLPAKEELEDYQEAGCGEDDPEFLDAKEGERELWARYEEALEQLRQGEQGLLALGQLDLTAIVERLTPRGLTRQQANMVAMVRGRIYIADEPERHLHPRLQRQAARWWVETMRTRSSQAVVATHSVPFLNLGAEASFAYVRRQPRETTRIGAIQPRTLIHLTEEAMELGLDRGELLTLVNVLLFVEGRHDQVVLEGLFGPKFHEQGITVVPMGGVSRAQGILSGEGLMRYTTAKVAAWFDNVPDDVLRRLQAEPSFAEEVRADRKQYTQETRHMAELLQTARNVGVEVEALPHPGQDVFDLLDERVIKELFPHFPGHRVARHAAAAERTKSGLRFKEFYEREYGIRMYAETYRQVALRMAAEGAVSPALTEVIERCERLALEPA